MKQLTITAISITALLIIQMVSGCQKVNTICDEATYIDCTSTGQEEHFKHKWWKDRHDGVLKQIQNQQVDLILLGDSITHGFDHTGRSFWQHYYQDRNAVNMGYSADRTEHLLWRINHGEVDGINPKVAVIMIGTNNTGHYKTNPIETAQGIKKVVCSLREKLPNTKILLLAIFPRDAKSSGQYRVINDAINEIIMDYGDKKNIFTLNINDLFLSDDGTLTKEIMPDLLHPKEKGYGIWTAAIEPMVSKLMGDKAKLPPQ